MDALKIGTLIGERRRELELTQGDLARRLHVSTQAVSKWERGLNFPDIALLEPLAEELGLTVSELLSGERNAPAQEALVRDSLRFSLSQLGSRARRWRVLFLCAALLLILTAVLTGYRWVRDNTDWLPQKETVITPLATDRADRLAAQVTDQSVIALFDLTFADYLEEGWSLQLELWDESGLHQSWPLLAARSDPDIKNPVRRGSLAMSFSLRNDQVSYRILMGGAFTGDTLEDFPIEHWQGYSWSFLNTPTALSRETGTVIASFGLDTGNGILADGGLGNPGVPGQQEGFTNLLVRLTCK